jgi:type I restriction enzyme S subunit
MTDQPRIDISAENWNTVHDILLHYLSAREIWAFGSRAKSTAKTFSDLDIAVIGSEPMGISLMATVREAFQESALPFKVDIVDWATTSPEFQQIIERDKVVLFEKHATAKN